MAGLERDAIEQFARYWDAAAAGASDEPDLADPTLAATVSRLYALEELPDIDPAFQSRLEARLLGTSVATVGLPGTIPLPMAGHDLHTSHNGRTDAQPWRVRAPASTRPIRPGWSLAQLATAALLLLTLLGGVIAIRSATAPRPPTYLEAAGRTEVETLVDATIVGDPATAIPLTVERWTIPPGSATVTVPPLDGPQWIVAESGSLTAAIDGARHELAPGASLVITAGRTLVVGNAGQEEASALRGVASDRFVLEDYDRAAIRKSPALHTRAHPALPAGTSHLLFERLTLPPGAILSIEPVSGRDWVGVVHGRLGLTLVGGAMPTGWQSGRTREVGAGELLPGLPVGTQVSLRNTGNEPLVLLRLRVTPLAEGRS
jgi:mannose-6-phosphate isomerase-like protein (cupin superfamily)